MKKVIVSFADESGSYRRGMKRLEESLDKVGFDGVFKGYTSYAEIGSVPHKGPGSVPYAFKPAAMATAIHEEGPGLYLWADSPIYATGPLDDIFRHIDRNGYLFFDNIGYSIASYTSDACLEKHGMSREEAKHSKMLMSCVYGLNTRHPEAMELFRRYLVASLDGVSYMGDWFNTNGQVSSDPDCKGTRHDQSTQSILVKQLGLTVTNAQETFFAYKEHIGQMPISNSVCLWSAGIE